MGKHIQPNPAKRRPWWLRTKATIQAQAERCPDCGGSGKCPNCHDKGHLRQGCTVCCSTGVCPKCRELPVKYD